VVEAHVGDRNKIYPKGSLLSHRVLPCVRVRYIQRKAALSGECCKSLLEAHLERLRGDGVRSHSSPLESLFFIPLWIPQNLVSAIVRKSSRGGWCGELLAWGIGAAELEMDAMWLLSLTGLILLTTPLRHSIQS
jgi:hypothetical protein